MYKLALLFAILASAQAQQTSNGTCDFSKVVRQNVTTRNFKIVENIYEIIRINNTWNTGHCTSLNIKVINATNSASIIMKEVLDQKLIERNATFTPASNVDHYNIVFSDFNSNFTYLGSTDTYIVLYACSNAGEQKQEYSWVLGAKTTLTESETNTVTTIIKNNNLENATWVETSHSAESCKSGGISNIQLSPIFVLIFGFLVSKGL